MDRDLPRIRMRWAVSYRNLGNDYLQAMASLNSGGMVEPHLEAANAALDGMDRLGRFMPYFLHDPDDGLIPIHPTVPDDIAHVLQLVRAVDDFIVARQ
jgi:hypothetical protein